MPIAAASFYPVPKTPPGGRYYESEPRPHVSVVTPFRISSAKAESMVKPTVDRLTESIRGELHGHWVSLGGVVALRRYLMACAGRIGAERDWKEEVEAYLAGRRSVTARSYLFKQIPSTKREVDLYEPYTKLLTDVGNALRMAGPGRAQVVDSHAMSIKHARYFGTQLTTAPDLSIVAHGTKDPDYRHIQSIVDAKLATDSIILHGLQLGVYARQMLTEQPDRLFVVTFTLSENHIRLFHFDRCGVMYSDAVNIRDHPDIFVLATVVLFGGLAALGLDSTIETNVYGDKIISLADPVLIGSHTACEYVVRGLPLVSPHTVRGRATTCWRTADGQFIIKDYWRAVERTFEADYLTKLVGVDGVGQLRAYQGGGLRVSDIRGLNRLTSDVKPSSGAAEKIPDRVHCRLVLDSYDGDLSHAPNPLVLLIAFRDAINGHKNALLERHILHRDVSLFNVMYDAKGGAGNLGRLIDFDLAKTLEALWDEGPTPGDLRTGTRLYQSVKVLHGRPDVLGRHDHMDDLESFLYILIHISLAHEGGNRPMNTYRLPELVEEWNQENPLLCAKVKHYTVASRFGGAVSKRLERPFLSLIRDLQRFFKPRLEDVQDALPTHDPEPMPHIGQSMEDYLKVAAVDYAQFLAILDRHIARVSTENPEWAEIADAYAVVEEDISTFAESFTARAAKPRQAIPPGLTPLATPITSESGSTASTHSANTPADEVQPRPWVRDPGVILPEGDDDPRWAARGMAAASEPGTDPEPSRKRSAEQATLEEPGRKVVLTVRPMKRRRAYESDAV